MESMEAGSSSSLDTKQLSDKQQFWRLRRKSRMQQLPTRMAVSMGLFLCLTVVAEQGFFGSWTTREPASAVADIHGVTGGRLLRAQQTRVTDAGEGGAHLPGRQLQTLNATAMALFLGQDVCPVKNSSYTFPALDFEDRTTSFPPPSSPS